MILNPSLRDFLKISVDFAKTEVLKHTNEEYVALTLSVVFKKLSETIDILSDENLDNRTQLRIVWGSFVTEPTIAEAIRLALLDAVTKINDVNVKEGLTLLVNPIVDTIVALSDKDQDNGKQLETIWIKFATSESFLAYAEKNLELLLRRIIKNEMLVNIIVSFLKLLIKR